MQVHSVHNIGWPAKQMRTMYYTSTEPKYNTKTMIYCRYNNFLLSQPHLLIIQNIIWNMARLPDYICNSSIIQRGIYVVCKVEVQVIYLSLWGCQFDCLVWSLYCFQVLLFDRLKKNRSSGEPFTKWSLMNASLAALPATSAHHFPPLEMLEHQMQDCRGDPCQPMRMN